MTSMNVGCSIFKCFGFPCTKRQGMTKRIIMLKFTLYRDLYRGHCVKSGWFLLRNSPKLAPFWGKPKHGYVTWKAVFYYWGPLYLCCPSILPPPSCRQPFMNRLTFTFQPQNVAKIWIIWFAGTNRPNNEGCTMKSIYNIENEITGISWNIIQWSAPMKILLN